MLCHLREYRKEQTLIHRLTPMEYLGALERLMIQEFLALAIVTAIFPRACSSPSPSPTLTLSREYANSSDRYIIQKPRCYRL